MSFLAELNELIGSLAMLVLSIAALMVVAYLGGPLRKLLLASNAAETASRAVLIAKAAKEICSREIPLLEAPEVSTISKDDDPAPAESTVD